MFLGVFTRGTGGEGRARRSYRQDQDAAAGLDYPDGLGRWMDLR